MRDKSVQEITEYPFPPAAEVILTAPDSPRSVRPETLAKIYDPNLRIAASARDALREAQASAPDDLVVITGSLYLAGEILGLLQ